MSEIIVNCERDSHLYKRGEKIVFQVCGSGKVHIEMSLDTQTILFQEDVVLMEGVPYEVNGSLDEPGFLRCRVWKEGENELKGAVHCGAGVDVHEIKPCFEDVEDFDLFWKQAFDDNASVESDVQLSPMDELSNSVRKVYSVNMAAYGRRIYGYLSVPEGEGPFPGIVLVPGAGGGQNNPCLNWLDQLQLADKAAMLVITVHPFPLPQQCDSLDKYINGIYGPKGYFGAVTEDPKDFFFYRFLPGAVRMAEWFAAQKFVDPERVMYRGGSQGGFAGYFLAAFSKVFKAAQFFVPSAYCDVGGVVKGRQPSQSRGKAAAEHAEALRYFDCANAAKRITCPVQVFIGFVDDTCFPSGVYAAYNELTCEKNVVNMVHSGHAVEQKYAPLAMAFLRENLNLACREWV